MAATDGSDACDKTRENADEDPSEQIALCEE